MSSCVRILDNNYTNPEVVANAYYSSADADFPITNLYNKYRRGKLWRTAGYFDLSTGTYKIIFRESVGVDLTATITSQEYTSVSDLLTEIKTQMEAVGASTYTVTQDTTTKKIKIVSNGAGGGGVFQLILTDAQFATFAAIIGFDTVSNLTGALSYTADELKIHTSEWIKWDFGIPSNPKSFVLIANRNKEFNLSPSATIKLQGNSTDNWTAPEYEQVITFDDFILSVENKDGLHTSALRYWRFVLVDQDNPLGYVQFGFVYLGDSYAPTRGAAVFPFQADLDDLSDTIISEGGQTYSYERNKGESFQLQWQGLTKQECEYLIELFQEFGTHSPLFFSFDSEGAFTTVSNKLLRYVKFNRSPSYQLVSPNNFSMSMSLREEL